MILSLNPIFLMLASVSTIMCAISGMVETMCDIRFLQVCIP